MSLLSRINKHVSNIPGKKFKDKFIVFESDDWGAIRMSSNKSLQHLLASGIQPADNDEERYLFNDKLESAADLQRLFSLLSTFKDFKGRPPVFTGFCLSANPDFEKIRASNFSQYFYENVSKTYQRYYSTQNIKDIYWAATKEHLFSPEFHGREHLNVPAWMKGLQSNNRETLDAFNCHVYGFTPRSSLSPISYQAAFDIWDPEELDMQRTILREGIENFVEFYGKQPEVFVAPNGPFNLELIDVLQENSIKYIGISKQHKSPTGFGRVKRSFHYLGQKNKYGMYYITRNCTFEPSLKGQQIDWVDRTMFEIEVAFKYCKPAVISTHRVNYMGELQASNRENGLIQLEALLRRILVKWPDVQFVTTAELGQKLSEN
jgi:hypothetical protein